MSTTSIRPYRPEDREDCLAAFVSNMPTYFADAELPEFTQWLDDPADPYFVIEREGKVLGSGGYAWMEETGDLSMTWGLIHNAYHGRGLGHSLTSHRIQHAANRYPGALLRCNTSQHTVAFYERFGFSRNGVIPDGYGPGLDKILMSLTLPLDSFVTSNPR